MPEGESYQIRVATVLILAQVHRKHLLPETLLAYNLPWDWDEVSIFVSTNKPNPPIANHTSPLFSVTAIISSSSAGSPKTSKKSSSPTPAVSARASWSPRPQAPPPNSGSTTAARTRCTWCGRRARADGCACSYKAFRLVLSTPIPPFRMSWIVRQAIFCSWILPFFFSPV
jgi:hypothetical protein